MSVECCKNLPKTWVTKKYTGILAASCTPGPENNYGADRYNASEERVAELIGKLPIVTSAARVPQYSKDDLNGCDIRVKFGNGTSPVAIQVKSSRERVIQLRRYISKKYGVNGDKTDAMWARERKIVINAGIKANGELVADEEILTSFQRQLDRIEQPRKTLQVFPEAS